MRSINTHARPALRKRGNCTKFLWMARPQLRSPPEGPSQPAAAAQLANLEKSKLASASLNRARRVPRGV